MKAELGNRIYTHNWGVYFDYRRKWEDFKNAYFDLEPWHIVEQWFVFIGFNPTFYEYDDFDFDGHIVKTITFCGIQVGKGYSYESKSIANWEKNNI